MTGNASVGVGESLEGCVPSAFPLSSDKLFRRIDLFVAPGGERGLVSCLLELPADRVPNPFIRPSAVLSRLHCRLDGVIEHLFDDLSCNRVVDEDPANADTQPASDRLPSRGSDIGGHASISSHT